MMTDPIFNRLREVSWRRKLTAGEEAELRAWLAEHPEALPDWEREAALNEMLGRLPDAPVASNFTARVLQAVERDAAKARDGESAQPRYRPWMRWLPRGAFAGMVAGAGLLAFHHHEQSLLRGQLVQSVATISHVASLPSPEILTDFDAVRVLNTPPADEQLLTLLK
jgi:anti-sigma factor RsiW